MQEELWEEGIMDSSSRLSPALARVWHGSVMRTGAAALSFFSLHCSQEETFNITVGLTHCPRGVWRAVACRLRARSHGRNAAASFSGTRGRPGPYVNMVHFILGVLSCASTLSHLGGEAVLCLWELDASVNASRWGDFREVTSKQS